ncbi:MAG: biotin-dependent carboxyltransferase family protein [Pseudomonadota bacterium]
MLEVVAPGVLATLQGAPRTGWRHMGMPYAGAADPVSLALANRLVGNPAFAPAIEATYGGLRLKFYDKRAFAVVGADGVDKLDGAPIIRHQTNMSSPGAVLEIVPPERGVRKYVAVAGGLAVEPFLGSPSLYQPAGVGGGFGRPLQPGDKLTLGAAQPDAAILEIPLALRPILAKQWVLRAAPSRETEWLDKASRDRLFSEPWTVARRTDRMGARLDGPPLTVITKKIMKSAPVFPGTVQCPDSGNPYLLGPDAQTTGGYPRIAQIALCDRHRFGQLRPGDTVFLTRVDIEIMRRALADKHAALATFVPDFQFI